MLEGHPSSGRRDGGWVGCYPSSPILVCQKKTMQYEPQNIHVLSIFDVSIHGILVMWPFISYNWLQMGLYIPEIGL